MRGFLRLINNYLGIQLSQSKRQSIEPIKRRQPIKRKISIERNRIWPRINWPFNCDSITFDNWIAIIRLRSIALFDWFDCDFRSIAIFGRSCWIDIVLDTDDQKNEEKSWIFFNLFQIFQDFQVKKIPKNPVIHRGW